MSNVLAIPEVGKSISSVNQYIAVVNRFPRLDTEEERTLALRLHRENDLEAAKKLILANLRFVVPIARGYLGYGLPLADLIQEGNIGLMKAVKRFDPSVGVRLISFAVHWIRAEIHEFILRNWRIVKVATTKAQRKLFFNLRKAKKRLNWLSQNEAEALASDLGVKVETVREMEKRMNGSDMAFDPAVGEEAEADHHLAPAHYLSGEVENDPAYQLERNEWSRLEHAQLSRALAGLDERSRDILRSRWLEEKKMTLHQLAEKYGVSAERIRQLEKSALKKLKKAMSEVA